MFDRLLALAVLLVACGPVDAGWIVVDGVELHPGALPVTVATGDDCDAVVDEAVAWWGAELGAPVFERCDDDCDAVVTLGLVPWDGDGAEPAGVAAIDFDEDGAVVASEVTLSSDLAYDRATMLQAARHELGHVLGLADDCGPPACVDLRSVMSSPMDPLGAVTDGDRARLAPYVATITGDAPEEMRR